MAVVSWTATNEAGDSITKAWADETRRAVVLYEGIVAAASTTGVTVTFDSAFGAITDYGVEMHWQEDASTDGGMLYAEKALGTCDICNSGAGTGYKIFYRVVGIV
jgi:hypothetical protein